MEVNNQSQTSESKIKQINPKQNTANITSTQRITYNIQGLLIHSSLIYYKSPSGYVPYGKEKRTKNML